ncbi:hypothetical protein HBB16_20020 [Pseudonocardia sp. MCCB 268]|nr:hypothetical protein [Pseudonocardia cytotoxica]
MLTSTAAASLADRLNALSRQQAWGRDGRAWSTTSSWTCLPSFIRRRRGSPPGSRLRRPADRPLLNTLYDDPHWCWTSSPGCGRLDAAAGDDHQGRRPPSRVLLQASSFLSRLARRPSPGPGARSPP